MRIDGYKILYDGAEVTFLKQEKDYSLEYFKDFFNASSTCCFSINHDYRGNNIVIDLSSLYSIKIIEKYFPEINIKNIENNRTYKFLIVLKSLMQGNGYIDLSDYKTIFASLCETVSSRNYECFKSFLCNYKNNKLICFFALRDVIENIKVYIYFLFENTNKYIIGDLNDFNNSVFQQKVNELLGTKKLKIDFEKIKKNNPTLNIYDKEFEKAQKINEVCNNYIHKNGYHKIETRFLKIIDETKLLDDMFFLLKLYLSIIICFDGKNISSTDYIDYLEIGTKPPKNSQYWVAPIYKDFINTEFSIEEIKKLKENTNMFI